MEGRNQFTFYRSYYEAVKSMKKADAASLLLALCAYALDGEEIPLSGAARAAFILIRPTLDSGRKKAEERSKRKEKKSESDGENDGQREQKRRTAGAKTTDSGSKNDGQWEVQNGNEGENEREKEIEGEREREVDVEGEEEIERDYHYRTPPTATPTAAATDAPVTAFDGTDLSAELEANRQAQALIRRYGLADAEATFCALMEDIGTRGIDAVRSALEDAARSDNRGGISVRYYRAILANQGKARPVRGLGGPGSSAREAAGTSNPFVILAQKYAQGGDGEGGTNGV